MYNSFIVVQWRHLSSEVLLISANTMLLCITSVFSYCYWVWLHVIICKWMHHLPWVILTLCDTWMTGIVKSEINAPSSQSTEIAVLVIISIKPLVLHRTPELQEALWHNLQSHTKTSRESILLHWLVWLAAKQKTWVQ